MWISACGWIYSWTCTHERPNSSIILHCPNNTKQDHCRQKYVNWKVANCCRRDLVILLGNKYFQPSPRTDDNDRQCLPHNFAHRWVRTVHHDTMYNIQYHNQMREGTSWLRQGGPNICRKRILKWVLIRKPSVWPWVLLTSCIWYFYLFIYFFCFVFLGGGF